jgi:hypothetical protein
VVWDEWEVAAAQLMLRVLPAADLECKAFSRLPYLSGGDSPGR